MRVGAAYGEDRRSYIELLRDPRWQKKRLLIMERDDWKCMECRTRDANLQVHHKRYVRGRMPWEHEDGDLVTLCHRCHERVTDLRKKANNLLADMNLYELPIAVSMLESFWIDLPAVARPDKPAAPKTETVDRFAAKRLLEAYEAEKAVLLAKEYTTEASRRVDELDYLRGELLEALAP